MLGMFNALSILSEPSAILLVCMTDAHGSQRFKNDGCRYVCLLYASAELRPGQTLHKGIRRIQLEGEGLFSLPTDRTTITSE